MSKQKKHRNTSEDILKKRRQGESVFCTWDADKSRGIEGLVVGRKSGKLCVGRVDGQVGAGTFHIVPTLFHNPAVLSIWGPARGEERRGCRKRWGKKKHRQVKTLLLQQSITEHRWGDILTFTSMSDLLSGDLATVICCYIYNLKILCDKPEHSNQTDVCAGFGLHN